MLGMAAPSGAVLHRKMADTAVRITPTGEAVALGRAVQALRERAGLSQEDLAEKLGVARQTVARYEAGRAAVLRTDLQRAIADALGGTVDDLMRERDNVVRPDFPGRPPAAGQRDGLRTVVAVQAQPEPGPDGEIRYVEVPPASSEDLGWLFGANAGFVRLADGTLPEGAFTARVAGFDRSTWPRRGQGCVIETRTGELLPRIYERRDQGGVMVRGGEGIGQHTVPAMEIKGVYAIRFWGD